MIDPSTNAVAAPARARSLSAALATGAGVGLLGDLIGLYGAEFRLPLLTGLFGFAALQAVIMNKAMSPDSGRDRPAGPSGGRHR